MAQTQTPCIKVQDGGTIPDPTTTTRYPGDVALLGTIPLIVCPTDPNITGVNTFDAEGIYDVPKDASTFSAGDPVYWNPTGNPTTGTAGTGCATSTSAGTTYLMGYATKAQLTGDATVRTSQVARPSPAAVGTFAAAGSTNADGVAITAKSPITIALVTGADATKGAVLPVPFAGQIVIVKNVDAANAVLNVYPGTGAKINALTTTTGPMAMAAKTSALFFATSATQWYTLPLLPS